MFISDIETILLSIIVFHHHVLGELRPIAYCMSLKFLFFLSEKRKFLSFFFLFIFIHFLSRF